MALALLRSVATHPAISYDSGRDLSTITLSSSWVSPVLAWSSFGLALVCVFLPRPHSLAWVRRRWPSLIALIVVSYLLAQDNFFTRALEWHLYAERVGPDSRTCGVLISGFTDNDVMLVRETRRGVFSTTYEELAPPRRVGTGFTIVIRPNRPDSEHTEVSFGANGFVLGVSQNVCWAAWDGVHSRTLTKEEIRRMSPFVLLGDADAGREDDLQYIVSVVRPEGPNAPSEAAEAPRPQRHRADAEDNVEWRGVPPEDAVFEALDSPNPWIRSAARRIVEAGGAEMYPEATRKLAPK